MISIGKKADKTKEAGHCFGTVALTKRQADKEASGSGAAAAAIDPGKPHQALFYRAQFLFLKTSMKSLYFSLFFHDILQI